MLRYDDDGWSGVWSRGKVRIMHDTRMCLNVSFVITYA
jgi:hypothetical protein